MQDYLKIRSKTYPGIMLRVIPGHFVTSNSHINYYIDLSLMKARQSEAEAIADAISGQYVSSAIVDTILCLDGTEVIGAYLAEALTKAGIMSMNAHKTIYITEPEFNSAGQMMFRDNVQQMIKGKHVLVLVASATTGLTLAGAVDTVRYYGGVIAGVSAIFSAAQKVYDIPIHSLFTANDLPDYRAYSHGKCQLCDSGIPIDAICNGYGFSKL